MLIDFFETLRRHGLAVSVREHLSLLEALRGGVIEPSIDQFHALGRLILVKDESLYDRYDQAFAAWFRGIESRLPDLRSIPPEWLEAEIRRQLGDDRPQGPSDETLDELLKRLEETLREQKERHEGGSRWVGTGGTSPFGNAGQHPGGLRIGGKASGKGMARRRWDERAFRDYDDSVELGTRGMKVALRRLRRFAREGAAEELDLEGTIRGTARNAGWLDLKLVPRRRNAIKVLLLMDVGGTMDEHVSRVEALFSAARSEFKHLEVYYFHNCLYDWLWKSLRRKHQERVATADVLRRYTRDWRLVFVGDATMAPYEILQPGGSVEYANAEAGAVWLQRMTHTYPRFAWLNPEPERLWPYRQSIDLIRTLMQDRMYPVTLSGLDRAMKALS